MKGLSAFALFLLIAQGVSPVRVSEGPSARQPAIFRVITIGAGRKLELGASPSDDVKAILENCGGGCFRLKNGTFGGAQGIEVIIGKEGRLKAIYFQYSDSTDYPTKRETYRHALGKPTHIEEREDGVQYTRWEDATTGFELMKHGQCVRAAMYDRRLPR